MDKLKLVIFDCDGVLIDSEPIASIILLEMLTQLGIILTLDDVFNIFVGKSTSQCLEIIKTLFGKSPPDNFANDFRQRVLQAFITDLLPIKGIHEVVSKLNLPYCVASNSSHDWINAALDATNLLPYFSGKIFSAKDVPRSKPYPDIFLYAAKKWVFLPRNV